MGHTDACPGRASQAERTREKAQGGGEHPGGQSSGSEGSRREGSE